MKIFVVEPRSAGGMIHYAYQLCQAMAEEGADVTLITSQGYELKGYPHNFTVNQFLKLWPLSDPRLTKPARNKLESILRKIFWTARRGVRAARLIYQLIRLTRYLVRSRPDMVQFGEVEFPFEGFFLQYMKWRGLKLAQICHEFESRETQGLMARLADRMKVIVFQSFDIIFLHGASNLNKFNSLYPMIPRERLREIVHGNEQIFPQPPDAQAQRAIAQQKYGLRDTNQLVLFFGTLTPSKGIPDLIKAFEGVFAQNPSARLLIAGMPTKYMDMSALFRQVNESGLQDAVIFDSRYLAMEEIAPLMLRADVVVLPYLNSSQSGAVQVAYSFGRPVVATNVGAFPEVIDDGLSGFLVPPGSPRELGKAITTIINDKERAAEMGRYAKHLSETRFAWPPIARNILEVYAHHLKAT
jgi:glycosyltransferase involved in cell wall biosynthesis